MSNFRKFKFSLRNSSDSDSDSDSDDLCLENSNYKEFNSCYSQSKKIPTQSSKLLNWLAGSSESTGVRSINSQSTYMSQSVGADLNISALEHNRNMIATDPLFEKRMEIQKIIDSLPNGEVRSAYQSTLDTLGKDISAMPTFNEPLIVNGPITSTGIVTAPTFDEVSTDPITGWYFDGRPALSFPIVNSKLNGLLEVIKIDDNNYRIRVYGFLATRPAPQLQQADFIMTRIGSQDIFQADGNLIVIGNSSTVSTRICPIVSAGERFLLISNTPKPGSSTANPLGLGISQFARKITPQSARHLLEKGASYRDALLNCHSPEELLKFWTEMFVSLNITGNERIQYIDPFAAPSAPRQILDYRIFGNKGRRTAEKYINLFKTTGFRIGGQVKRVERGLLDGTIKITMEDSDFENSDFNFLPFAGGLPVFFDGTGYSDIDNIPFTCSIAGGFNYAKPPPRCFEAELMEKGIMNFHIEVPLVITQSNNRLTLNINGASLTVELTPGYYRFLDVLLVINKELQKIHPSLYIWFYNGIVFDYVNQVPTTVFSNKSDELVYIRSDLSQNVSISTQSTILDLLGLKTAANGIPVQRQSGTTAVRLIVGEKPAITNSPVDGFLRILKKSVSCDSMKPLRAQTPHMQLAGCSFREMLFALHCIQRLMNLEEHVLTAGCGIGAQDFGRWYPETWEDMGFFMRSYFPIFGVYPSTFATQMMIIEPARFYTDLKLTTSNLLTARFPLGDVSSILIQNYTYTTDCIANLGALPFKNNLPQFLASPLLTRYMKSPKKIQALLASEISGPVRPVSRVIDAFDVSQLSNITSGGNILFGVVEPSIVAALTGTTLKVGYLSFPDMIMSNNTNDLSTLFQDDEISVGMPQIRQYMRAIFGFFKSQGVDRFIVDLRANGGGSAAERPFIAHIGSSPHPTLRSRFTVATAIQELNYGADLSDCARYVRSLEGGAATREEKCSRTDYSIEVEPNAQFRLTEGRVLTLASEQSYSAAKAFQNDLRLRTEQYNGFLDSDRKVDYFNLSVYGRPFATAGSSMGSAPSTDHLTTSRSEFPVNPFLGVQRFESSSVCYAGSRLPWGNRLTWCDANPNTGLEYFFRDIGLTGKTARNVGVVDFSRSLPPFKDVEFGRPWTYRDSNFERAIQIICDPNCRANAASDLRYGSTIVRNESCKIIRDLPSTLPRIW
jgi:hypothetical protein